MAGYKTWITNEYIEENPFTLEMAHECLWDFFCYEFEEQYGEQPDLDTICEENGGTMRDYVIDAYDWYAAALWEDRQWDDDAHPDKWDICYSAGVWLGHIEEEDDDNWTPPRIVSR